jgi:putative redox protein
MTHGSTARAPHLGRRRSVGSRRSAIVQLQGAVELTSRSVSSSWKPGPLRCEVTAGAFTIAVDEPESVGGTGAAPQPTDLLLVSLASCFTLALAHSAAKRAIPLSDVRVDVVGDYAGPRFAALHITVDATGPNPEELADLVEAAEQVCYVTNTLRAGATIDVDASASAAGRA